MRNDTFNLLIVIVQTNLIINITVALKNSIQKSKFAMIGIKDKIVYILDVMFYKYDSYESYNAT